MSRTANGQFAPGNPGGPGRPKRMTEADYLNATISAVSVDEWGKVVRKALTDAKKGNAPARAFLADYLLGKPPQILELRGAEAHLLAQVLDALKTRGIAASAIFEAMLAELAAEQVGEADDSE